MLKTVRVAYVWMGLAMMLLTMMVLWVEYTHWREQHAALSSPHIGHPQHLIKIRSTADLLNHYDVIVVGTEPEGIAAALSAARNGLHTLLIDGHGRTVLGGLMTEGWLNTIDMNIGPNKKILNQGIFKQFYSQVEGTSFDIHTAANVFYRMVNQEKNIDLLMQLQKMSPIVSDEPNGRLAIKGIRVIEKDGRQKSFYASAVIDATQNADIAAAAHVPYTIGRQDIGEKGAKMSATLIFRINHVTPNVWSQIRRRLETDHNANTGANAMSAWGYSGMYQYPSTQPKRVAMRGLNIGRQDDGTALINSMQIFNVDGLNPNSRQKAKQIAKTELPHVIQYMKQHYPEFAGVQLDGTAPELYIRETRHIEGEYELRITDLLENRDQWDRIAFGSYPVDIQRMSPQDHGHVILNPEEYAIPFRSIVPLKVDNLLVVGRSASYDSLASGSARTIPVGMAEGQAAGAAVKIALDHDVNFQQMSKSKQLIALLQNHLIDQGMDIRPYQLPLPMYMHNPSFAGLQFAVSIGFASGGYDNNFRLQDHANVKRMENFVSMAKKVYPNALPGESGAALPGMKNPEKQPLTLQEASFITAKAEGIETDKSDAVKTLIDRHLLSKKTVKSIQNPQEMTNGAMYMLLWDVLHRDIHK